MQCKPKMKRNPAGAMLAFAVTLFLNVFATSVLAVPDEDLFSAAESGNVKEVRRLLAAGADVNAKDKHGDSLFHAAARNGFKDLQASLLAKSGELNAQRTGSAVPKLPQQPESFTQGHQDVAKLLITQGADAKAQDRDGVTPLHLSAFFGSAVARLLIAQGADIHGKDANGATPLHSAAYKGNRQVAGLLIAKGAEVNAKDNDGYTPLFISSAMGHQSIAKLLITNGADVRAESNDSVTPLHGVMASGKKEIAELLIEKGADVNARSKNGYTPLHTAISLGNTAIAKLLLANGADIHAKDNGGATPLHLATHQATAALLIAQGADVNAKGDIDDLKQAAPLHVAATKGYLDVAKLLIAKGAEINTKDQNGRTPLACALENKQDAIAEILRQHGGLGAR